MDSRHTATLNSLILYVLVCVVCMLKCEMALES